MNEDIPTFTPEDRGRHHPGQHDAGRAVPQGREHHGRNWGEMPENWSAEHEAELPNKLQDWSWLGDGERDDLV